MCLESLQQNWNKLGETDPLWAVLTHASKKGNRWETKEFFETGEAHVGHTLGRLGQLGVSLGRKKALDFGCGVGRLSQALCRYFDEVIGADIAPSMIEHASALNRYGDKCRYIVNESAELESMDSGEFDLVYSQLVLQHMRPVHARVYIQEFFRVLRVGGVTVFQIPSVRLAPQGCTRAKGPLPDEAYRCEIDVPALAPQIPAADEVEVSVRVANTSNITWPAVGSPDSGNYEIHLGNHWLDSNGAMLLLDDGRARLPYDLEPGCSCEMQLRITAPRMPGRYLAEFDMVQENVTWFQKRGSTPLRRAVEVPPDSVGDEDQQGTESSIAEETTTPPVMEMFGIEKDEVVSLCSGHGKILDIEPAHLPDWESYNYYVRRVS